MTDDDRDYAEEAANQRLLDDARDPDELLAAGPTVRGLCDVRDALRELESDRGSVADVLAELLDHVRGQLADVRLDRLTTAVQTAVEGCCALVLDESDDRYAMPQLTYVLDGGARELDPSEIAELHDARYPDGDADLTDGEDLVDRLRELAAEWAAVAGPLFDDSTSYRLDFDARPQAANLAHR